MTKHHWRQQIKSFFESHGDPEKHEQLKQSRKEMEEKKEKMMKLIKSEQQDGSNGKTESLEELIKDYHKQYESLYEDYHNLTGEMNKNVYSKNGEKGKSSTSSSDSDSDIDSSSKGRKNGKLQKEIERVTNELQRKLEAATHEIDDFRNKLDTAEDGKEAARLECTRTLDNLHDSEKTIQELKVEATRWSLEIAGLKKRIIELEESALKKEDECLALRSKLQNGEKMSQLENENAELRSKVVDLELNLRSAERKTDDLSRGNQFHDQLVIELQTTIEDLKRDIEMDKDELTTIEEKNCNLEVMLRLSNQKLRVTEQLLNEKDASHKRLEERNTTLSQTLGEYSGMIRDVSEQLNTSQAELEQAITDKLNQDYGGLAQRVITISKEVRSLKSRVEASRSENNVSSLAMQLEKVLEEGAVMRKTIEKLEAQASKAKAEKEEAVMEKDERLSSLEEEKREAIRQLCVWTEYYRNNCAELQRVSSSS